MTENPGAMERNKTEPRNEGKEALAAAEVEGSQREALLMGAELGAAGKSEPASAEAIKALVTLAIAAMKGAPAPARVVILAVAGILILTAVVGAISAARNQSWAAFGICALAVAASLVLVWLLLARGKESRLSLWQRTALDRSKGVRWGTLRRDLEEIRTFVLDRLRERNPQVGDENVRANVFLLDYSNGCEFGLYMPSELRIRMDHPLEWELRLHPGEGVTGVVFMSGGHRMIRRASWQLREGYEKLIHPELRWVASFALNDPEEEKALGVLNVDGVGIDEAPDEHDLEELLQWVDQFAERLSECPKVRLTLMAEEVPEPFDATTRGG